MDPKDISDTKRAESRGERKILKELESVRCKENPLLTKAQEGETINTTRDQKQRLGVSAFPRPERES